MKKVGVLLEHPLIAFITSGTAAQWYSEEDSKEEEEEKSVLVFSSLISQSFEVILIGRK